MSFKKVIHIDGKPVETLEDILPATPGLEILFVAKTPSLKSVNAGHYFQGRHGTMFWNRLKKYGILKSSLGYEDESMLNHRYGITDIVKVPRNYGNEPTVQEYKDGLEKVLNIIRLHSPKIVVFVYKRVLDQILKHAFNYQKKSNYGFNNDLDPKFGARVFVFPMPGTPCRKEEAKVAMEKLSQILS